jgi:DNA-binding transcriptional MerR regulator
MDECRVLLSLYRDDSRASADVKAIAQKHLTKVDSKIAKLQSLRAEMVRLIDACAGDHRPDCPILDELATPETASTTL